MDVQVIHSFLLDHMFWFWAHALHIFVRSIPMKMYLIVTIIFTHLHCLYERNRVLLCIIWSTQAFSRRRLFKRWCNSDSHGAGEYDSSSPISFLLSASFLVASKTVEYARLVTPKVGGTAKVKSPWSLCKLANIVKKGRINRLIVGREDLGMYVPITARWFRFFWFASNSIQTTLTSQSSSILNPSINP